MRSAIVEVVRELVANALIHQDFFVTGTGPMVEIFDDRIEITNPGAPLVDMIEASFGWLATNFLARSINSSACFR